MESYSKKTFGSYIEELESIITWNFKHTDLQYGNLQAAELKSYVSSVF